LNSRYEELNEIYEKLVYDFKLQRSNPAHMSATDKASLQKLIESREKHFSEPTKPLFGDIRIDDVSLSLGENRFFPSVAVDANICLLPALCSFAGGNVYGSLANFNEIIKIHKRQS
jgi:hypothetical protein